MYTELIIKPHKLADQIMYPDTARKLVAEACDGVKVSPILFNRQENGKTLQGKFWAKDKHAIDAGLPFPAPVFFDGGKGFIRIIGIGDTGCNAVTDNAPTIAMAISKHVGSTYGFELRGGDCGIERKGCKLYSIRRLVAAKKPTAGQAFYKKDALSVTTELSRIIYRGILSQAKWLAIHGNESSSKLDWILPDMDTLDIDIVSGDPYPILINNKNYAYGYSNLVFSMNATLAGPWQCGMLRSRGYGAIRPYILKGEKS